MLHQEMEESTLPSPRPLILLTGGFRTRTGMHQALTTPVADLIGVGRPAAADPYFARKLLDTSVRDDEAKLPNYDPSEGTTILRWFFKWLTLFGPSLDVFYHNLLMHSIAFGKDPALGENGKQAQTDVESRLAPFWTLVRRNYLDSSFPPILQRLVVWSVVGLVTLSCVR